MRPSTSILLAALLFAALFLSACAETVILLPDRNGTTGRVVVSPRKGSPALLDKPYAAAEVSSEESAKTKTLDPAEVREEYAEVLAAEPDPPKRFILYFQLDTARLLPESRAALSDIMAAYRESGTNDVSVVGHTDRSGEHGYNVTLSQSRAERVAGLLREMGMYPDHMEVTSHGESNPLVPTEDEVFEPRNRRVEVTVR